MKRPFVKVYGPLLLSTVVSLAALAPLSVRAERAVISLDGQWQVADSQSSDSVPSTFLRSAPVPGLDDFFSREHLVNRIRAKLAPEEWLTNYWPGKVNQERNYFWYRKSFRAPK